MLLAPQLDGAKFTLLIRETNGESIRLSYWTSMITETIRLSRCAALRLPSQYTNVPQLAFTGIRYSGSNQRERCFLYGAR